MGSDGKGAVVSFGEDTRRSTEPIGTTAGQTTGGTAAPRISCQKTSMGRPRRMTKSYCIFGAFQNDIQPQITGLLSLIKTGKPSDAGLSRSFKTNPRPDP